jgi:peptidoglycan/xylan/chitin deacetylase (PgdA/CDA1 family)
LRRAVEQILGPAGRGLLRTPAVAGRALILAYHNVVPDEAPRAGDSPLHLPVSAFARQLDLLAASCDVVPLQRMFAYPPGHRLTVAITFDDAYRGALTLGAAELARRSLPATVFVPTGMLDDRTFWWDDLARGESGLPPALRERALVELQGKDAAIRAAAGAPVSMLPTYMRTATLAELGRTVTMFGFTLGAHTWGHPNLAALPPEELGPELERPLPWLREHFPMATIPWIAYPYGLATPSVHAAAAAAGYAGGLRVEGGWFRPDQISAFAVPRLNVPSGVTLNGFALRLAGLRP